jgi:hypothetical protein
MYGDHFPRPLPYLSISLPLTQVLNRKEIPLSNPKTLRRLSGESGFEYMHETLRLTFQICFVHIPHPILKAPPT